MLVGVTFIWGSTFVLMKDIVEQVPPMLLMTTRFGIGALALTLLVTFARRWTGLTMREIGWGCVIGVALGLGYAFQTIGLQYTSASNAAFITGLLVVFAPIIALFLLRQKPTVWAVLGVLMATVGLAFLSLRFDEGIKPNWADAIVLLCAFAFAIHVVLLAYISPTCDALRLATVQVVMAGIVNGVGALIFEKAPPTVSIEVWAGVTFLGILATALAFAVQTSVQSYTTVVHASLIFTLEPVFAAIFAFWLQGDRLGPIALTGAAMIVGGMLIAELGPYLMGRRLAAISSNQLEL